MSNYNNLKSSINNNIYENQTQQITGTVLNAILNEMTNALGAGYQFAGVATVGMTPSEPDARIFYLAGEGIYTSFDGIQVPAGKLGILKWDNRWHLETIDGLGSGGANLTGYVTVASTDDLPDEGVATLGYLCGENLYLYVGEGGDTKEGKYQDCGSFRGPQGDSVQDVEQTQTSLENGGVNKIKFTLSNGISCEFQVRNGTTSSGLFPTLEALQAAYPSPVVGQYAFVGAGFPADIYVCTTAGTWTDSGEDYDGDNVDLTDYATKAEVNQLEAEVTDLLTDKNAILESLLEYSYFTQSSPTIVSYSAGFQTAFYPVKAGETIHIVASNSSVKSINYGFTTIPPAINVQVLNAVSVNTSSLDEKIIVQNDGYFVIAKYQNYFTDIAVNKEQPEFDKLSQKTDFVAQFLEKGAVYVKESPLDFTKYVIIKGFYDITNSTGVYYQSFVRACIQEFIPVKKYSRINATIESGFQLNVLFYNISADGKITYIKSVSSTNSYELGTAVPYNCNAVKLSFYPYDNRTNVDVADVTPTNFNITITTGTKIEEQSEELQAPGNEHPFKINENGGWEQGGLSLTAIETTRISNAYPIKVIPGHRYSIEASPIKMANIVIRVSSNSWKNSVTIALPDVYHNRTTINPQAMTVIIPKGYEYMWLVIVPSTQTITPQDGEDMDIRVIDVTGDLSKMQRSKVVTELHTQGQTQVVIEGQTVTKYSQGMAVNNGYLFQAYSTGEIEVYDYSTMQYLSTFVVNYGLHLGQLTFGEKANEDDEFGVLWVDGGGNIYGYKITRNEDIFTTTLLETISAPTNSNLGNAYALDIPNKKVALFGYKDSLNYGSVELVLYSISEFVSGATFTEESSMEIPHFGSWPMQSGIFRDGKLYMICGTHNQNARIYCLDFAKGDSVSVIDLRRGAFDIPMREEPQAICVYDGRILFSGSYCIYELFL